MSWIPKPPFSIRTILGLIIGLMGCLGILLALFAGNSHRNLVIENQRDSLIQLVHLKSSDLLEASEEHARDLGIALQSDAAFRQAFDSGNRERVEDELSHQFHQYFVTANVLKLEKLTVFGPGYSVEAEVTSEASRDLMGVSVCPGLIEEASRREGAKRARVLSHICVVRDRPLQMVLVSIGGLRPRGYLGVVVDPVPTLLGIEQALGMPLRVRDIEAASLYRSAGWPPPHSMDNTMVAEYMLRSSAGVPALSIAVLSDHRALHAKLGEARLMLMVVAGLVTLLFIVATLLIVRRTTVEPLQSLTAQLRGIGRGRGDLLGGVHASGAAEIRELATDFNQMVSELDGLYETLEAMAFVDGLTGLPNRNRFHETLTDLVSTQPNARSFAILLMDLDRFKAVNDTLGHHIGDELLKEVGSRLRKTLDVLSLSENCRSAVGDHRRKCLIARIGGDEFAALMPDLSSHADAIALAQALISALETPCLIGNHKLSLATSIGIALFPEHGTDQNTLMRRADLAMYHAKSTRKGFALYASFLDQGNLLSLTLESDLNRAIAQDELFLEYQPQIDLATGEVVGAEALVRWMHPEQGLVQPNDFISVAEQTGIIQPLTRWVLRRALRDCAQWQTAGHGFGVSVNLSPINLHHPDIFKLITMALDESSVRHSDLTFELTESAVMADPEYAIRILGRLAHTGVRVAIDDFGTGHCSLSYIKKLPTVEIKIDRSFVMDMNHDASDHVIVRSTIGLAHNMGLTVVAEGVEDEATLGHLRALGCDKVQGFHILRPAPFSAFMDWLDSYSQSGAERAFGTEGRNR